MGLELGYKGHERGYDEQSEPASIEALRGLIRPKYTLEQVEEIERMLVNGGTFILQPESDGTLPAAGPGNGVTDYKERWLRDQMQVADVEFACGDADIAVGVVKAAMRQSLTQRRRFGAIINNPDLKHYQNNRPHIRWGANERELPEEWGHAQNDALGHFLRVQHEAIVRGHISMTDDDITQLGYHARYLEAINYWEDEDHGCWEEQPKRNNSSISIAKQGLEALIRTMGRINEDAITIPEPNGRMSIDRIEELVDKARHVLDRDLPNECVQGDKWRGPDAALLIPVWTGAIKGPQADEIVQYVLQGSKGVTKFNDWHEHIPGLKGELGIKRYHNDKYWNGGLDPQWLLFNSMVSSIEGRKHQQDWDSKSEQLQVDYFNDSLMQITTNPNNPTMFAVPELKHVAGWDNGNPIWEVNPNTPLLWAAANHKMMIHDMKESLRRGAAKDDSSLTQSTPV